MKKIIGLAFVLLTSTSHAAEDMCIAQAYTYGLASQAQDECHFSYWNGSATDSAKACYVMSSQTGKTALFESAVKRGTKDFKDKYQATSDKKGLCNDFADDFPDYVKN